MVLFLALLVSCYDSDLACRLPAARQQFLRSHLVVQTAIQRFAVEAIGALANATFTLSAGGSKPSPRAVASASADVVGALAAMDALFQAQRDAEGREDWRGM